MSEKDIPDERNEKEKFSSGRKQSCMCVNVVV